MGLTNPASSHPKTQTLSADFSQESCEFCHQLGHSLTTRPDLTLAAESQVPQITNAPNTFTHPRTIRTSHSSPSSSESVISVRTDTQITHIPHGHPAGNPVSSRDLSSRGCSDIYEQYEDLGRILSRNSPSNRTIPPKTIPLPQHVRTPHPSPRPRERLDSSPLPARTSQHSLSARPPRSCNPT